MRAVYSRQAISDLERIATYYRKNASPIIAQAAGERIEQAVQLIATRRTPHLPWRND